MLGWGIILTHQEQFMIIKINEKKKQWNAVRQKEKQEQ